MMNSGPNVPDSITALLEKNQRLEAILASISDGIFTLDHQLVVTYFNATAARLLNRPADTVVGRYLFDAFPEAKGSIFEEKYTYALREKQALSFETFFDVSPLTNWYEVRVYPSNEGLTVIFQVSTLRKQADAALEESELRFRALAERIHEVFWLMDLRTGKVLYVSPAYEQITGRPRREVYRHAYTFLAALHPEDRPKATAAMQQIAAGQFVSAELRVVRLDGEVRWIQVRTFPVQDAAGQLRRLVGVAEDITARKQAESELLQTAQFPNENPFPVMRVSRQGLLIYINRSGQDNLSLGGFQAGEPVPPSVLPLVQAALQSGQLQEAELETGGRLFSIVAAPFLANDYVNLYGREITEQRRAQAEREQLLLQVESERNLWKTTVESMLDPVTVSDAEGHAVYMNSAYERMIQRTIAEGLPLEAHASHYALYQSDGSLFKAEDLPLQRAALKDEEVSNMEIIQVGADGQKHTAIWNASPLHDPQGKLLGAVAIGHEVTKQRQAEQALQAYTAQLERLNRELQDFAFIASHDLQEPLRKIQAFANRIQADYSEQVDATGKEYLNRLGKAASRMREMIDDLLDYSRVSTHGRPFEPVELKGIVDALLADMDWSLEREGAQVKVGELPAILADPVQISRLLRNLLMNALKFRHSDRPLEIRITAGQAEPGLVQMEVADNGIGFDEQYRDRLFQPFSRLVGREKYEGTGMGLAICRKIVERHNGTIAARSQPGEGATFIITLPAA